MSEDQSRDMPGWLALLIGVGATVLIVAVGSWLDRWFWESGQNFDMSGIRLAALLWVLFGVGLGGALRSRSIPSLVYAIPAGFLILFNALLSAGLSIRPSWLSDLTFRASGVWSLVTAGGLALAAVASAVSNAARRRVRSGADRSG